MIVIIIVIVITVKIINWSSTQVTKAYRGL